MFGFVERKVAVADKAERYDPAKEELPETIPHDAWVSWVKHRRAIGKPVAPTTAKLQIKMLTDQPDPAACIEQSVINGWTGLFPLRGRAADATSITRGVAHSYNANEEAS